jgi:hypothetical protein
MPLRSFTGMYQAAVERRSLRTYNRRSSRQLVPSKAAQRSPHPVEVYGHRQTAIEQTRRACG